MDNPKDNQPHDEIRLDKKVVVIFGLAIFVVIVIAIFGSVYFYLNSQKTPSTIASDTATIMLKVERLVNLPSGETPQVVPVVDISLFKNQPFFARGRVGDVLIVYKENHVAILYNPELNKIINMSRISILLPKPSALP